MNDDLNKDVFRKRIDKLSPEQKEQLKKMLLQKKQKDNSASERIIPKSSKADVFPLSFSQERIYTTEKLFPNTSKYHCPGLMKAYGFIDTDIIERSLNIIADKHEIIKAVFFERDGSCYYRIDTTAKIIPEYYDLSEPNHQSPSIDDIVRKSIHQTFDLYKGPLVRLVIIKMKNDEILFINNFHHIIYDLLSAHIFIRDLFNVYKALKNSELLPENKPLIQYYDYSLWQRELFKSGKFNDSIAYWEKKLAGAPQFLKLLDQGKISDLTEDSSNRNEMITFTIPETLLDQIQSFCKGHDITVFALFFSVLNMLIFRYTGQNDILLGIPVNGRNTPDAWNLIGCFINTLAIRTIIDENTSCFDLLR